MYDFITIERSYACGGHEIAKALSKKLNYRLYDHSVVVETCKRLELPYNQIHDMDEQVPVKTFFKLPGDKYMSMEEKIFLTETEIIRDAAQDTGAIFVGRCAGEILSDKNCLRVFITASPLFRMERAIKVEEIPKATVERTINRFDIRREKFFEAHSDGAWGDPENFDLVLNSGQLGIQKCVDILVAAAG